jgi:DNA-binding response OmpR family regulator
MIAEREPSSSAPVRIPARTASARASTRRWTEATGAHVLAVDPVADEQFGLDMASRGVHVTSVASTLDGLVEFGRTAPYAILIAPATPGIPPCQFIHKVREYASPVIIAVRDPGDVSAAGELLLAGATAAVTRPYSAAGLWETLEQVAAAPVNHARVQFGPIELDALAYTVRIHGERIADLPLKEFELLLALMLRAPEVLNNEELRTALWGSGAGRPSNNTISAHVGRLRSRLHGIADIRRIYGRGYSLTLASPARPGRDR